MTLIPIRSSICALLKINSWVIYAASLYLLLELYVSNAEGMLVHVLGFLHCSAVLHPLLGAVHAYLLLTSGVVACLLFMDTVHACEHPDSPREHAAFYQRAKMPRKRLLFFYLKTALWLLLVVAYLAPSAA